MSTAPVTLDMSTAQPIQAAAPAAPVKLDMSTAQALPGQVPTYEQASKEAQAYVGGGANLLVGSEGIKDITKGAVGIGEAAAPYVNAFLNKPTVKPVADLFEKEIMKLPGADTVKAGWGLLKHLMSTEETPTFPCAPFPEAPMPKAAALGDVPTPAAQPAAQTGEALGQIPAPWRMKPQASALGDTPAIGTPAPTARQFTNKVGPMVDDALGNPSSAQPAVTPGQPIYRRTAVSTPAAEAPAEGSVAAPSIPEGHTAVEGSNAVKSFKYDADAQEMHIAPKKGYTYVYGDASPDQADAFQNAESKGNAWLSLKNSNPLVAKILPDGTRIAVKPSAAAASSDDLTGVLQQSVDAVNKAKWKMKTAQ